MKKLPFAIGLLAALFFVAPARGTPDTLQGFDMLRKIIILNRMAVGGEGAEEENEGSGAGGARAKGTEHFETHLSTRDAESAELAVEITYGDLTFEPAGGDTLIFVTVDYDADKFPPPVVKHRRKNGHVKIWLEWEGIEDADLDDIDMSAISGENTWGIRLGREVTWSLDMEVAFCEMHLELGGLKVAELSMESGFSEIQLSFSEPNGTVLESCDIESGLGSLQAMQLGNAAIRRLTVENGLGSSLLDFTGAQLRENIKAVIESGLGSVKMQLPDGLPVMIHVESTLGTTDLPGFDEINGGRYRSIPYPEGVPGLEVDVSIGLGSVGVIWVTDEGIPLPPKAPLPPEAPKAPKKAKVVD